MISLDWDLSWFGCDEFDANLVKAVQKWQKAHGLTGRWACGPNDISQGVD